MTLEESFGDLRGRRVAFVGDGNNVAHSLIQAAGYVGFNLVIATPEGYRPDAAIVAAGRGHGEETGGRIELVTDPRDAVAPPTPSTRTSGRRWARRPSARSDGRSSPGTPWTRR